MTTPAAAEFRYQDFTEHHYAQLVRTASAHYRFVPFTDFAAAGNICLWRHDVDFSPQRARRLAVIEADAGVSATYFLNLHSEFYNALEGRTVLAIRDILAMGHFLGLHFEAAVHGASTRAADRLDALLVRERDVLEQTFGVPVACYSLHNPGVVGEWQSDETTHVGMVNAYCRAIAARFTYVSDSNGIWRHRRLADVLAEAPPRLHVLTHPGWWTPTAMSPRARVSRCIDGRAKATHESYDRFLAECGRPNVGREDR